jgi:hypothetical protein
MHLLKRCLLMGLLLGLAMLTGGLLILIHRVIPVSPWWQLAEIGTLLIVYGLIEVWSRLNLLDYLRHIRCHATGETDIPSFSVYEPVAASTVKGIPPAPILKPITSERLENITDPPIYLHKDFSYSQN